MIHSEVVCLQVLRGGDQGVRKYDQSDRSYIHGQSLISFRLDFSFHCV